MGLVDQQRNAQAVCLRSEPPQQALAQLGDRRGWLVYREMVRTRLRDEVELGLRRSCRVAGQQAVTQTLDRYLEQVPPRTRLFREVACHFGRTVAPWWKADASLPAYLPDLCLYEVAVWEVADLDDRNHPEVVELAFDRPPVLSPALRLLALGHVVHTQPAADGGYTAEPCFLAVHRPADDRMVQPWRLNRLSYDLLCLWQAGGVSVTQAVQRVGQAHGLPVDATFVDGLCTVLADFIEKGIILGSLGAR